MGKMKKLMKNANLKKVAKGMRIVYTVVMLLGVCPEFYLASQKNVVLTPMNNFYDLMASIVTTAGEFFLLWGISEWGISLQSGNGGMMEGNSIKRLIGGFIGIAAPDLVKLLLG